MTNERWATRIIPEPFRDFVPFIAVSALGVIHRGEVLRRALRVIKHTADERTRAEKARSLATSLAATGLAGRVTIRDRPATGLDVHLLSIDERKRIGNSVLGLYFHQIRSNGPLFLDLRPRHFNWDPQTATLSFFPSGLWLQPEPDFMQRVRALYSGFYDNDPAALREGIELCHYRSDFSPGFPQRIERLLRGHFGPGETQEMTFTIAHFRSTFDAIFQEVDRSGAKLHPEMTFLGVLLVGLYLTLETLNVPLSAREAFESR